MSPLPFLMAAAMAVFPNNEDLRHIRSINEPLLSPDGKQVLLRVTDATADGGKSHIWLVDIDSKKCRQLTYSPEGDKAGESSAAWMPDGGSILFVAHRGEHTQLFRLPMNGGEAKAFDLKVMPAVDESKQPDAIPPVAADAKKEDKAEALPIDVAGFEISPDGKTIAFLANDPKTPGEKKQSDAKADAKLADHEIHGMRLYLLDPATNKITSVPVPADVHAASFARDSSKLVVISEEPNGASDLKPSAMSWVVRLDDPAHPLRMAELPATVQSAEWSYDGNSIDFLAQAEKDTPPGYHDLYRYDLRTHKVENLLREFDGSIGFQKPIALADGSLITPADRGFTSTYLRVNEHVKSYAFPLPVTGSLNTNLMQSGWVFLGSGPMQPTTLFYTSELGKAPMELAIPDLTPVEHLAVPSKRFSWKSDGFTIEGLLYLPPEAKDHKVPLIVEVHGGPLGAYLDSYQPFVDFLVGHGWAVLRTNPRGSTNYGAAFAAANKNDLGGGDYRDIMAGVDEVLKTEPIDETKMALEGYSYGGEMAGFVEGKTDRFKAIVCGAPVIDQYSEYGTEGDSYYDRWYFGKPWEHPEDAWRQSPLSGVGHAKTPFLLLQGESDTTDPLGQSAEMYRALRQAGVPVELVTYPRENHGPLARGFYGMPVSEPWHGFDARQRMVQFITKAFGEAQK